MFLWLVSRHLLALCLWAMWLDECEYGFLCTAFWWASRIFKFRSSTNLGNLLLLFLQSLFFFTKLFLPSSETPMTQRKSVRHCLVLVRLSQCSPLSFSWCHFYSSVFSFTDSFLCHLHSAIEPTQDIFIEDIIYFSLKNCIWFFFIASISQLKFSIFPFVHSVHFYLIKYSYNSCFEDFVWWCQHLGRLRAAALDVFSLESWTPFPGSSYVT